MRRVIYAAEIAATRDTRAHARLLRAYAFVVTRKDADIFADAYAAQFFLLSMPCLRPSFIFTKIAEDVAKGRRCTRYVA